MAACNFEDIDTGKDGGGQLGLHMKRAKVPGGWLVAAYNGNDETAAYAPSVTFVPDPTHRWDGNSLPDAPTSRMTAEVFGKSPGDREVDLRSGHVRRVLLRWRRKNGLTRFEEPGRTGSNPGG